MNNNSFKFLVCPKCSGKLALNENPDGIIHCHNCSNEYLIRNDIPRFVHQENYADSFGFQWNLYARTQIDKYNGTRISEKRFYQETQWKRDLKGEKILEAGSGAGRFTQIALDTGAKVFSVDYSQAVEANYKNNGPNENLAIIQADIYNLPFKKESFDKIYCLGVLQHCPEVEKAFLSLSKYLKKNGEIVIDVYKKDWKMYLMIYYWLRPITKRFSKKMLLKIICFWVPVFLPMSTFVGKIPIIGKLIRKVLPIANYEGILDLEKEQLREWSILDTFDRLSPAYDNPQKISDVRDWFKKAGYLKCTVDYGYNGIVGRGIKS